MMMEKRQDGRQQEDLDLWNDFWSAILAARTASSPARFTYSPSSTTSSSMNGGTVVVTVPGTTIYVSTTIISTTFITVPAATVTASSGFWGRNSTQISVFSTGTVSTTSTAYMSTSLMSTVLVPSAATEGFSTSLAPTPTSSSVNSTADGMIGAQEQRDAQKHAIIGGLSGSIAGLLFIGVLVCLALRLRRKKDGSLKSDDSMNEKGVRPTLIRKWTQLTGGGVGSPKQMDSERSATPVKVDEDHRIIRMNTRHWPRPFAAGTGEGYRESQPQGTLRVVNPDQSRPETPDLALSHFKNQRPSLAGFVYGVAPKSSPDAKLQTYPVAQKPIPTITVIDPNLSRECIATYDRTPSFRSYPSIASTQVVSQHPPDDPFVTSSPAQSRPRRPSITTLQSTPARTWTQLSSHLLHPFAKRTSNTAEPVQNVRGLSHFSVSSSASRSSRRSDPFDLSVRGSQPPREAAEFRRGSPNPTWILYDGT